MADGPDYRTLDEALEGRYSGSRVNYVVIGRVTRKLAPVEDSRGGEVVRGALYELEIVDPLGADLLGLAPAMDGSVSLFGFDLDAVDVIDTVPPNPQPGMVGVFVIGSTRNAGEVPYGAKFGRPYAIYMFLKRGDDGSFHPSSDVGGDPVSLDAVREAAERAGQHIE